MFGFLLPWAISFLVIEGFMLCLWAVYLLLRNVSLVDIGWGVAFIFSVVATLFFEEGYFWRKLLLSLLVFAWSGRLIYYLSGRFQPGRDDPRYDKILSRSSFKGPLSAKVLCLYLLQGAIAAVLALPFILIGGNSTPHFSPEEIYGVLIWAVGFAGLCIADGQLAHFKANPQNEKLVCRSGLWRYSRHPNYFFEWIVWIGYAAIAFSAPLGWLGVVSPLLMFYLLTRVSGVPITEEVLLQTKGDAYKQYQAETHAFFPWFYKETKTK